MNGSAEGTSEVQDATEPAATTDTTSEDNTNPGADTANPGADTANPGADTANPGAETAAVEDLGTKCESDADCQGGPCVQTANGGVCSQGCEGACPEGWSCVPPKDADTDGNVCVPDFETLCMPCSANAECNLPGGPGDGRCIPRGDAGSFCGSDCTSKDCPTGYACEDVADLNGEVSKQCVKAEGTCECSPLAISIQASTPCLLTNELGSCSGERQCSESGLSGCEGKEAAAEVCDGVDNNCDGVTDEGFPNTDGTGPADCTDEDDDGDGVVDALDCAPFDPAVFPNCANKQCGDDGCGGSCGACGVAESCVNNQCVCQPSCDGKQCGGDGCGGSCGSCTGNDFCQIDQCVCIPNCFGKQCGDDGCGGSCGDCTDNTCVNGQCVCEPNCDNKICGDDGCGGSCGTCTPGQLCSWTPGDGTDCTCPGGKLGPPPAGSCNFLGSATCTGSFSAYVCIQIPGAPCPTWAGAGCGGGCLPKYPYDVCFAPFFP